MAGVKKYLIAVPRRDMQLLPVEFEQLGFATVETRCTGKGHSEIIAGDAHMLHGLIEQLRVVADKKNGRTGPEAGRDRTAARQLISRCERALATGPVEDQVAPVESNQEPEKHRVGIPLILYVTYQGTAEECLAKARAFLGEVQEGDEPLAVLGVEEGEDGWVWGSQGEVELV